MPELHFSKAPIVEAILNIILERDIDIGALEPMKSAVRDQYPTNTSIYELTQTIELGSSSSPEQRQLGWQLRSLDELQLCQVRVDGFSFHRLAPYTRWEEFRSEARRLWTIYRSITGTSPPIRAHALRYINRLQIQAGEEISDYLLVYPQVPAGLPQTLNKYSMYLDIATPMLPAASIIMRQALIGTEEPNTGAILLDLELRFPVATGTTDDGLWNLIESARDTKNTTFLNCLTEKAKEKIG